MSNATSLSLVPPLNGGYPCTLNTPRGSLLPPTTATANTSTRLHPWSKSRKSPRHLSQEKIERIRNAQVKAGLRTPEEPQSTWNEPPPLTSAAASRPVWMKWLRSWFSASAQTIPPGHRRAGIVTFTYTDPNTGRPYAMCQAWVDALKKIFDPDQIHVLPVVDAWPYIRNLVKTAPDGTLLTTDIKPNSINRKSLIEARDTIEAHFEELGVPVKRLSTQWNFANVEYIKEKKLLVVAGTQKFPLNDWELWELKEAFGFPEHVIKLELDVSGHKETTCYDLDLTLLLMPNDMGQWVALLDEYCLTPESQGAGETFARHGILVVPISKEERSALVTNSVWNPEKPGKLVLTRSAIPDSLVPKLGNAGLKVVRPDSRELIGNTEEEVRNNEGASIFGAHCVTFDAEFPADEDKPHDGL